MPRLAASVVDGQPAAPVPWSIRGEVLRRTGAADAILLHLRASADVWLQCQRCLEPLAHPIGIERSVRFVEGEDAAAALDAESEDDVLALSRAFDVVQWLEDELLLALPLVPRHNQCQPPGGSQAVAAPVVDDASVARSDRPHPFAALAVLKDKKGSGS